MLRKSSRHVMFALSILSWKYREGQKMLHCDFVTHDRMQREKLIPNEEVRIIREYNTHERGRRGCKQCGVDRNECQERFVMEG